jgi:hypothetical protein
MTVQTQASGTISTLAEHDLRPCPGAVPGLSRPSGA